VSILIVVMVLGACSNPPVTSNDPGATSPDTSLSAGPKVLRIGLQREPADFLRPGTVGPMIVLWLANDDLTVPDGQGGLLPRMATEVPSIEKDSWKIYPDGSMDVTWRLRSDARWHDGRPVTSDDYLFAWEYMHHPGNILPYYQWVPFADQLTAPDPFTFVAHFPETYALASVGHHSAGRMLQPIPRHILGDLFASNEIEAFNNSSYWSDDFVGMGPYKAVKWERGASIEFVRFDNFPLGRPPLDRVILSFHPDLNAMVSSILAGELDLCTNCKFSPEQTLELQRRWGGNGNQVLIGPGDKMTFIESQSRPEAQVMPEALRDRSVRQALYRAIDRQAVAEAIGSGTIETADSWIAANDPRRKNPVLAQSIAQYPFDPQRAERELQQAGWRRGTDGVLVNQAGDRFEFELRTFPDAFAPALLAVTADSLKGIGVSALQRVNTPQQMNDREFLSLFPGLQFSDNPGLSIETSRLRTDSIGRPANRYAGTNRGGYSSSQMDTLSNRLAATIPDDQRTLVQAELLRLGLTDLPLMPMYWATVVHVMGSKVRNVPAPSALLVDPRNQPEWDITR
jgi:peptide/nickel transport system substrate-binding protein